MRIFSIGLLLSALAFAGCKGSAGTQSPTLTGKLVIKEICNHFVVELVSGKIDSSKLAVNWTDTKRNLTYPLSFSVASRCSFAEAGLQEGDTFSFELAATPTDENCAQCMAYYPTPEQSLAIRNIRKINK